MTHRAIVAAIAAALLPLAPFTGFAQPKADPYKIGVTYPLTGPLAPSGKLTLIAIEQSVDDINKAADYLKSKGIKTRAGPLPIKEGPAGGQTILYFLSPWGLQLELISYPKGMAYAKTSKVKLWAPTSPGK